MCEGEEAYPFTDRFLSFLKASNEEFIKRLKRIWRKRRKK